MSLAIQINLNKSAALDGTTELPTPGGAVTKSVDSEGVVVLEADTSTDFGAFDPGSLLGSKSADFVLQSLQVSAASGAAGGPDNLALLGPAAPGGTAPRFVFHTLAVPDGLFEGAQIIPAGYKISILHSYTGKHVVRLTLWPITRIEQLGLFIP
jgi:hypothetical protein